MASAEAVLAARIRVELSDFDRVVESVGRQLAKAETDPDYLGSAAFSLAALYGGIERTLVKIAHTIDEAEPTRPAMGRQLLLQMSTSQPNTRPPVLQAQTSDCLERYRELSGLIWEIQAFKLPSELIRQRADELPACYQNLSADLQAFCSFLESLD